VVMTVAVALPLGGGDWTVRVIGAEVTIGSAEDQQIRLEGPGIAPRHAVLSRMGHHTVLLPLAGAEVLVGGEPLASETPAIIDWRPFTIGMHELRVNAED